MAPERPLAMRPRWSPLLLAAAVAAAPAARAGDALQPCADDAASLQRALQRLNAVRAAGTPCDGRASPPAPPLAWETHLFDSARALALDLAARGELSHEDAQGRALAQRLQSAGYAMKAAAENLARGTPDFDATLAGWLASPAHCANLMRPDLGHAGLACVQRGDDAGTRVWVAQFASPRRR